MYLFITYARKDMRGVQVRGLRVAKQFSKREVMFINGGDAEWIKKAGYKYKNYDFNKFYLPSQVKLPGQIKCIIFCDLPTNRAFQLSILLKAKEERIPCVVLDNIYRRNQFKDTVYRNIKYYTDNLILNGLSFMGNKERNLAIVPPLIETSLIEGKTQEDIKNEIIKNFKLKKRPEKIIFGIGYNPSTYKEIVKIYNYFKKDNSNVLFVVVSQTKKIKKRGNFVEIPPLLGDKMTFFTRASDLVISRAGYLQVIETLALGKPLVALGQKGGFRKKWLDKKILDSIIIPERVSYNLYKRIKKLINSSVTYQKTIEKIKALHNGKLNGPEITADLIRKTKFHPKKFPKILIISLDKEKEMSETKKLLRKYPFALPIYFSMPFFTNVFERKLSDYDPTPKKEVLHYNPALIYSFDYDGLHSFTKIFPWYNSLFKNLENFVKESDKCIVVGKETYNYLEKIISKYKRKIEIVDKNFKYNIRGK